MNNSRPIGFVPALGTPLKEDGSLNRESYGRQIELMTGHGAIGVLCMGSMGNMASLTDGTYFETARACVDVVSGRIPVYVGVMDNSIARVADRIKALGGLDITGVVATPPFYYKPTDSQTLSFFKGLAEKSEYPVYIYDLPPVTQAPVDAEVLRELMETNNIAGIKTANLEMLRGMGFKRKSGFDVFFSGLDIMDRAVVDGFPTHLDGMFTCVPKTAGTMYGLIADNNIKGFSEELKKIIGLRDIFVKHGVFAAYSHAMAVLGMPGTYHPDYHVKISAEGEMEIERFMEEMGEA